jgi:prophage regulatory protein
MSTAQTLIPYEALAGRGIPLCRSQIWRLEKAGKFPKRVAVSAARCAWVEAEIDKWIADRIAARSHASAAA